MSHVFGQKPCNRLHFLIRELKIKKIKISKNILLRVTGYTKKVKNAT